MARETSIAPSTTDELWLERLLQLLHDPPGKVTYLAHHKKLSKALAEAITQFVWTDEEWKAGVVNRPDAIAAGADRPCLPWAARQPFYTPSQQVVTHPLGRCDDAPLLQLQPQRGNAPLPQLSSADASPRAAKAQRAEDRESQREAAKRLAASELGPGGDYEGAFYRVWRRFREELIAGEHASHERAGVTGESAAQAPSTLEGIPRALFWSAIPADSRCPDVSIWDHVRVTAGLSFMNAPTSTKRKPTELHPAREPWLVQVSLSGVQRFIRTARTSRDLWVGSFLLSDLAFHAMLPFIEEYGPTAVLYPDLWRNPRMDAWLAGRDRSEGWEKRVGWQALPTYAEPTSFAAVIPNSFVVVVPRGGGDGLPKLEDLADSARKRVAERWRDYADVTQEWFGAVVSRADIEGGKDGAHPWRHLWERQNGRGDVVRARWSAVPWERAAKMDGFVQAGALPWQDRSTWQNESPGDRQRRLERYGHLAPWVSESLWDHCERTRYAFGNINPNLLQMERGFDYAVTNAELRAVHQTRKQAALWPEAREETEAGVKCSLCGERSALTSDPQGGRATGHVDALTERARSFWSNEELDPERNGAERLCAVCATKRFLVTAGGEHGGINGLWATERDREAIAKEGGKPRVPFPSTTAICAQRYIAALCRSSNPRVLEAIQRLVDSHRALDWPRTQFPRCLRLLAEVHQALPEGDVRREFLMREPQELLYPDAIEAKVRSHESRTGHQRSSQSRVRADDARRPSGDAEERGAGREMAHLRAARKLLEVVADPKQGLGLRAPGSYLAVIKVDGDSLSKLLTGEPERIHARWEDVLHPEIVETLRKGGLGGAQEWQRLLPATRMMGPSLHAFVTRALGEFAHRIAPWVVEQEFHGRLVYAGGDDLLALAPADEALGIVARLQQLYAAPWVLDTQPQSDAWAWRRPGSGRDARGSGAARARFRLPLPEPGSGRIIFPVERFEAHSEDLLVATRGGGSGDGAPADNDAVPRPMGSGERCFGPVIPMLGKGQSLSAGIVYAHFKDALGALVHEAQTLLDEDAKVAAGRAAVAFAWRSRGGEKLRFSAKWTETVPGAGGTDGQEKRELRLAESWSRVVRGFALRRIPSGLPYKLRDVSEVASVVAQGLLPELESLERLVDAAAPLRERERRDVAALWRAGFSTARSPDQAVSGLAICRALAAEEPEERNHE